MILTGIITARSAKELTDRYVIESVNLNELFEKIRQGIWDAINNRKYCFSIEVEDCVYEIIQFHLREFGYRTSYTGSGPGKGCVHIMW